MKYVVWFLLFVISSFAKAQQINFERAHPLDLGWYCMGGDIVQVNDSVYIGVGFSDASYPYPDTLNMTGYIVEYFQIVFKINNQGDTLFIRNIDLGHQNFLNTYGYYPSDAFQSAAKINESSFVATGLTQSALSLQNQFDADAVFHKFDNNGDSMYTLAISVPDSQFWGENIIKTSDNYLITVASSVSFAGPPWYGRGHVLKLDTSGNLIWRKVYGSPIDMHFSGIAECPDGGFVIAARKYNGTWYNGNVYNPVMMKIDSLGNVVWQKIFPTLEYSFLQGPSVTRTSDDNYIFSYPDYNEAPKHFKTNVNGDTLWSRSIDTYRQDGFSLQSTFSAGDNYGGIVAIATVYDSINLSQGAIYRLSSDGNLLWNRKFGAGYDAVDVHALKATSDSGFIVTGGTWCCNHEWPTGANLSSLYVIKFDSLGLLYPIGVQEHPATEDALLSIPYPNPAATQTTFTILVPPPSQSGMIGEKGAQLLVFDMQGRQLQKHALQTGLYTLTIDVSSLASGEYLCVLSLDGYNAGGRKIIVQH